MAGKEQRQREPRDGFRLEVDPERIDEAVRVLAERVRRTVEQGRYTRVRLKYRGKAITPDIPLGVFIAAEAAAFWYAGLLRALVVNLGVRTIIDVELVHDAAEKVRQGNELFMQGEVEEAEALYREALRMKPDDPTALYRLGVLLRVIGHRDEAIQCLEKAAAADGYPDAEKAREALRNLKRGPRTL